MDQNLREEHYVAADGYSQMTWRASKPANTSSHQEDWDWWCQGCQNRHESKLMNTDGCVSSVPQSGEGTELMGPETGTLCWPGG